MFPQTGRNLGEKVKSLLLALLGAAHSLNHSLFLVLPMYLPKIAGEFGASLEVIGLIAAMSGFLYGAGSLVGGSLSDRLGEIRVLAMSLALSGVSTLILLIARDLIMFGVGLLFMGAWASLYHPTANSVISKVFQRNMAEAMGIHGTGGNIGFMFAPIITVAMGDLWGWRYPLLFFGLLNLVVSTLLLKTSPPVEKTQAAGNIWDVIRIPGLWTLLVYDIAAGLYYKGVEFIFPTFLENRGFSSMLKGVAVFSLLAVGILGQWLGGRASDSCGSRKALIATSTGVVLGLILLPTTPHAIIGVSAFIILYGVSFYGHQPALNSLAGLITPNSERGTVFGVLFFFTFGLGSASIAIASSCADRFGLESVFHVMTLFSIVALILSLKVPSQNRHLREQNNDNQRFASKL